MSTKTCSRLVGLSAPGLWWLMTLGVAEAAAQPQSVDPPSSSPRETPTEASPPVVLLLHDGRILEGELSEDGNQWVLRQKAGTLRLARKQVEGVFDSIVAIYRHKLERVAEDDPDEHRKLANWCLSYKLTAEARTELEHVLALNPNDRQAKAQLFNLKASETRQAQAAADAEASRRDEGLVRTAAQKTGDGIGLDRRAVTAGPPTIFDLPPALAVKRYQEFALAVHPELQKRCVGCHNERSTLPFQLVKASTSRDQMNELILRTNLEATLVLVDRDDPARSPLLVASVLPHKGLNQSILGGTNHPTYRAFAQWVAGVSTPHPQFEASPLSSGLVQPGASAGSGAVVPTAGGGFASQRGTAPAAEAPMPTLTPTPPSTGVPVGNSPTPSLSKRSRATEVRTGQIQHPSVPSGTEFPTPMTAGGPAPGPAGARPAQAAPGAVPGLPTLPGTPAATPGMPPLPAPNPVAGQPRPGGTPAAITMPPATVPGTGTPAQPGAPAGPGGNPALLPMADPTRPDPKNLYPPEFDKTKTSKKSLINLDALDKFMRRDAGSNPKP